MPRAQPVITIMQSKLKVIGLDLNVVITVYQTVRLNIFSCLTIILFIAQHNSFKCSTTLRHGSRVRTLLWYDTSAFACRPNTSGVSVSGSVSM